MVKPLPMSKEGTGLKFPLAYLLFMVILLSLVHPVNALIFSDNGSELSSGEVSRLILAGPLPLSGMIPPGQIIFFTNTHCGACHTAHIFLEEYVLNHSEVNLMTYDLFNSPENRTAFEHYKKIFGLDSLFTPSVMVGNFTLEGTQDIRIHLDDIIQANRNVLLQTGNTT